MSISRNRWYDANQVVPVFPFGHGLSYTTFSYDSIAVSAPSTSIKKAGDTSAVVAEVQVLV